MVYEKVDETTFRIRETKEEIVEHSIDHLKAEIESSQRIIQQHQEKIELCQNLLNEAKKIWVEGKKWEEK
jgi:hypothetical protein